MCDFQGYEKIMVLLSRKWSKSTLTNFKQHHLRILQMVPSPDFEKEGIFKQTLQLQISFYSI